ncbi:MAG TPA: phage holin family protein [Terriglobales bacterium]|jgi:putative membrane protein|nr:phage holin family protein [Terriglobales bacterium]
MLKALLHWVLNAVAIILVSRLIAGFQVSGLAAALIAALVVGFLNATIGFVIKVITFPLSIITLGLFWLIINAVMLELASGLVPGFKILSFGAAFWGSIVLSIINMIFRALTSEKH